MLGLEQGQHLPRIVVVHGPSYRKAASSSRTPVIGEPLGGPQTVRFPSDKRVIS